MTEQETGRSPTGRFAWGVIVANVAAYVVFATLWALGALLFPLPDWIPGADFIGRAVALPLYGLLPLLLVANFILALRHLRSDPGYARAHLVAFFALPVAGFLFSGLMVMVVYTLALFLAAEPWKW